MLGRHPLAVAQHALCRTNHRANPVGALHLASHAGRRPSAVRGGLCEMLQREARRQRCDAPLVVVQLIAREGDSSRRAARARTSSTPRTITAILRSIWSPQSAAPQSCNVIGSKVFEVQRLERGGESPEAECGGRSTQQNSRGKSIRCR